MLKYALQLPRHSASITSPKPPLLLREERRERSPKLPLPPTHSPFPPIPSQGTPTHNSFPPSQPLLSFAASWKIGGRMCIASSSPPPFSPCQKENKGERKTIDGKWESVFGGKKFSFSSPKKGEKSWRHHWEIVCCRLSKKEIFSAPLWGKIKVGRLRSLHRLGLEDMFGEGEEDEGANLINSKMSHQVGGGGGTNLLPLSKSCDSKQLPYFFFLGGEERIFYYALKEGENLLFGWMQP